MINTLTTTTNFETLKERARLQRLAIFSKFIEKMEELDLETIYKIASELTSLRDEFPMFETRNALIHNCWTLYVEDFIEDIKKYPLFFLNKFRIAYKVNKGEFQYKFTKSIYNVENYQDLESFKKDSEEIKSRLIAYYNYFKNINIQLLEKSKVGKVDKKIKLNCSTDSFDFSRSWTVEEQKTFINKATIEELLSLQRNSYIFFQNEKILYKKINKDFKLKTFEFEIFYGELRLYFESKCNLGYQITIKFEDELSVRSFAEKIPLIKDLDSFIEGRIQQFCCCKPKYFWSQQNGIRSYICKHRYEPEILLECNEYELV